MQCKAFNVIAEDCFTYKGRGDRLSHRDSMSDAHGYSHKNTLSSRMTFSLIRGIALDVSGL